MLILTCKRCGAYMEYTGEGTDPQEQLYDLYLCIECGHEQALPQDTRSERPGRYDWDPPDGMYDWR
jgi:DNA-directed RNA polymerase subunit RPC12/RpoP